MISTALFTGNVFVSPSTFPLSSLKYNRCTCEDGIYTCGNGGFDCKDPTAPTDCPTPSPAPTLVAGLRYPDCTGGMSDLQNGRCDWDLNNEECGELRMRMRCTTIRVQRFSWLVVMYSNDKGEKYSRCRTCDFELSE